MTVVVSLLVTAACGQAAPGEDGGAAGTTTPTLPPTALVVGDEAVVVVDPATGATDPSDTAAVATEPAVSTTVAPTTTTIPSEPAVGVLRTSTGVLVPLRARRLDGTGWVVGTPCGNEAVVAAGSLVPSVRVVLDPGHGGAETGTVGTNGVRESTINLDVALRIEALLRTAGITVQLTRRTDAQSVLDSRAELARSFAPEVIVSVHHNGGQIRSSEVPGTIAFHQVDSPASRRLGGILHEEVEAALIPLDLPWVAATNPGTYPVRNLQGTNYYGILRGTAGIPAVIVEAMYLTNRPEAEALERDEVRQLEAQAITDGIVRFLTTNDAGSGFRNEMTFAPGSVPHREPASCTDPLLGS